MSGLSQYSYLMISIQKPESLEKFLELNPIDTLIVRKNGAYYKVTHYNWELQAQAENVEFFKIANWLIN